LRGSILGVLKEIEEKRINGKNLISDINLIAEVAEEVMGGTSGSLYSIFFSGLGAALGRIAAGGEEKIEAKHWSEAAESALANLYLCKFKLYQGEVIASRLIFIDEQSLALDRPVEPSSILWKPMSSISRASRAISTVRRKLRWKLRTRRRSS
jgi:hypothetical protein